MYRVGTEELRETLFKFMSNPSVRDVSRRAFLPNIGGCTVYTFGDVRKIREAKTEICARTRRVQRL